MSAGAGRRGGEHGSDHLLDGGPAVVADQLDERAGLADATRDRRIDAYSGLTNRLLD